MSMSFFTDELAAAGRAFSEDMPVLCERFEVVYKPGTTVTVMETERLRLRLHTWDDLENMETVLCDRENMRFYRDPFTRDTVRRWLKWHMTNYADLGFGLFDDSFMHRCHDLVSGDGYNERCWQRFPGQWKVGPCGGEISYYAKRDQREFLNPKGLYGVTWAEAAAKYHMTFVIANDCLEGPYATAARIAEAGRECGWRLSLTQPKTDGRSSIVNVTNVGVAPVYHDIRVRLGGETSSDSLKGLLPGGTRAFVFAPSNATPELISRKLLKPIAFSAGQPSP